MSRYAPFEALGSQYPGRFHSAYLRCGRRKSKIATSYTISNKESPMQRTRSDQLYARAKRTLPGGVNSPVRAFNSVGGQPLFIERGSGPYLYDADGNRYIDYVMSWGPLILGHAHREVTAALKNAIDRGTSYGAPTKLEIDLAELVCEMVPSIDTVRFVNSGTEATMGVIRLARAATGRDKIIKFSGCYHGHPDALLVKAGSGVATLGLPDSPGVPEGATRDTLIAEYNDLDSVRTLFDANPDTIAGVILEPVAGNMGVVPPADGFLHGLRQLTSTHGALLIFDEVMTGFRVDRGGAQALYGVTPDLTTLGKVIGGGLPVGAYGGRSDLMSLVAPAGPMYQAGTLSGNPLAMTAGLTTLQILQRPGVLEKIIGQAERLCRGIGEAATAAGRTIYQTRVGTMFCTYFTAAQVTDWESASAADTEAFAKFFNAMLTRGIYLAPSQYEAGFTSLMHSNEIIDQTIEAAVEAFKE
jgi:glutamate-1-semialdehyde 2,1-aminomutase